MKGKKENKTFLIPIILLVVLSVLAISFANILYNVQAIKKHIIQEEKYRIKNYKDTKFNEAKTLTNIVDSTTNTIDIYSKKQMTKKALTIKLKFTQATISHMYYEEKEDLDDVIKYLESIKNNNNKASYIVFNNTTHNILLHPNKNNIGKKVDNILKALDGKISQNKQIDISKDSSLNKGLTLYASYYFEPLDIVVIAYKKVTKNKQAVRERVLQIFKNIKLAEDENFILLELDGALKSKDVTATMVLNFRNPKLVGMKIDKNFKDKTSLKPLQIISDDIGQKKYSYRTYKLKMGNKTKSFAKYVQLQKNLNWLMLVEFDLKKLNEHIARIKQASSETSKYLIQNSLIWIVIIGIIVLIIAIFLSRKIDKTINKYTNKLIENEYIMFEQSKLASMGDMIGNIAHQWRQPLTVISTCATGMKLEKELDILSDEEFANNCDMINDNAQYLSSTIDDFKNYIKGDRVLEKFTLKHNFDSFYTLVKGSIKNHKINLDINCPENLEIKGYPNELIQCYINIFNNAKDVLKPLHEDERFIFVDVSKQKNIVKICFKDNGGGIADDILPKVFEPYFTTKHKSQGTGLGLHMTYNLIVDGMKGSVNVTNVTYIHNNKEYTGANFEILLPMDLETS